MTARRFLPLLLPLCACAEDQLRSVAAITEEFTQNAAREIDILWVVDNSDSMAAAQSGIAESFDAFIAELSATDVAYQIGVISTDPADGGRVHAPSGVAFITPTTANANATFRQNVLIGTGGAAREEAFTTASMALGLGPDWMSGAAPRPPNSNFPRADAALFVIMVSDEDEKSFGPVGYYRRLFESYKGAGNEGLISVSAVVGPEGGCFFAEGNARHGMRFIELAGQTGGVFASICDEFASTVRTLSITATGLRQVFVLSGTPNLATKVACEPLGDTPLCVRVGGEAQGPDATTWSFDDARNAVIFAAGNTPKAEAKVTVTYHGSKQ